MNPKTTTLTLMRISPSSPICRNSSCTAVPIPARLRRGL